jgi:hypothetical protein
LLPEWQGCDWSATRVMRERDCDWRRGREVVRRVWLTSANMPRHAPLRGQRM